MSSSSSRVVATLAAFGVFLVTCHGNAPTQPSARPRSDGDGNAALQLTAWCADGERTPSAVDVALSVPAELVGNGGFELADNVFGTSGMAPLITGATAIDDRGALPLVRGAGPDLALATGRRPIGTVTLRYRAISVAVHERGARFGLRHDATGIGGAGAFFVVLPAAATTASLRTRIAWGPSACAAETSDLRGFTSLGFAGASEASMPLSDLRMTTYMFGRPRVVARDALAAAWFGEPALDVEAASGWAARVYAAERALLGDRDPAPYHLFLRVLPELGDRANGTGQRRSFLSAIGPATPFGVRLRTNIAHEMLHRWIGLQIRLAGREGTQYWFTEGFTVHYALQVLRRAGLVTPDETLGELNFITARHFDNPRRAASNEHIAREFFSDEQLSVVPYTRGALYAAELDAAIRRASRGARSLDDVIRALASASERARPSASGLRELPSNAIRDAAQSELGFVGGARFDAVIVRGETPEPPPDAYGPCFRKLPSNEPPRGRYVWVRVLEVADARCVEN